MTSTKPILYSFRRCPYAMRARMAIQYAGMHVELREVVLKDKPASMLAISPKATVPVLQLNDGEIIDESIDVVFWAVKQNDPQCWLSEDENIPQDLQVLIGENDGSFKSALDKYKYCDRFPEKLQSDYRAEGEVFLQKLEGYLTKHQFLFSDKPSLADIVVMPFIRQFAHVDINWFKASPYPKLIAWLDYWLASDIFTAIMKKYPAWQEGTEGVLFPEAASSLTDI